MTIMMMMAEYRPNLPISLASFSSFYWRGVGSGSSFSSSTLILPMQDCSPTTITIILPSPERTLVPLIMMGDGTSCLLAIFFYPFFSISIFFLIQNLRIFFLIGSISPVIALSSVVT